MSERKEIWIISGEESGDIYGAMLADDLADAAEKAGAELKISIMGGKRMAATGAEVMVDATELGVVGLVEVFKMIGTFIRVFRGLVRRAKKNPPDAAVLIDYPGFNLRLAKRLHKLGVPVVWYISPQVWAWKKGRVRELAEYCSKMLVIFPFETEIYEKAGLEVEFVGHPLVDIAKESGLDSVERDDNLLLLLPGSRSNEINRLFVPMLETAVELKKRRPELRFAAAAPRESVKKRLEEILARFKRRGGDAGKIEVEIRCGETPKAMREAATTLVASGTATVECAIANLPATVVYKLNPITYALARMVIDIPFFTMVNIIANERVYEEYLQGDVNAMNLADSLEKILPGGERRKEAEKGIRRVVDAISAESGRSSARAAEAALAVALKNKNGED